MKILISNDDGVFAPGLAALASAMSDFGETLVIAPDRNRSAASNSLTLDVPLRVRQFPNGFYAVDGTPTDCVHLALRGAIDFKADCVVSGINAGSNLGDDVLYSGTVAAAMEGRFLGMPAIAFSMATRSDEPVLHYETGAEIARFLMQRMLKNPLPRNTILNVNIPDKPIAEIKGIKTVRLGRRHQGEAVIAAKDPRGHDVFWIGPSPSAQDDGPGTDFDAIVNGYVTLTPLQVDLTLYEQMTEVEQWSLAVL